MVSPQHRSFQQLYNATAFVRHFLTAILGFSNFLDAGREGRKSWALSIIDFIAG